MGRNGVKSKPRNLSEVLEESKQIADQARTAFESLAVPLASAGMPVIAAREGRIPSPAYVSELKACGVTRFKAGELEIDFAAAAAPQLATPVWGEGLAQRVLELQLQINQIMKTFGTPAVMTKRETHAGPVVVDDEELDDEISNEERAREVSEAQKEHDAILFHSAD